jgi:hypothetical protein
MEIKNKKNKVTVPPKGATTPKKRISKTMQAAVKFQGAFDREEVIKFAHS